MAGPTTTGLAALLTGEGWHYVGEAGEPAFTNSWTNATSGIPKLAFRIRETGVVDLQGVVQHSGTSAKAIFTLPTGYRPSGRAYITVTGVDTGGGLPVPGRSGWLEISTAGVVTPVMFAGDADYITIAGQFFLVPPDPVP